MHKSSLIRASLFFFFLGILTCTWDFFLKLDLAGFTLKAHQLFFLLAFAIVFFARRQDGFVKLISPLGKGFALSFLGLASFYFLTSSISFFPLKSALYSCWLVFNIATIWLTAQLLAPAFSKQRLAKFVWWSALLQAAVIVIDHIAYQFGYTAGLVGHNQDAVLKWGASRPHAFSSEPSYIATFLSFGLILSYASLDSVWKKANRWKSISLPIIAFAVLAATSRTGWLTTIACFMLFEGIVTLKTGTKIIPKIATFFLVGLIAFGVFFATTPKKQRQTLDRSLVSSVTSGTDGSGNARLRAHLFAWQMAKETNFIGTGLGASYKYWIASHPNEAAPEKGQPDHGHEVVMSTWGQLLAEGGLVAVGLYLLAATLLISTLYRAWRLNAEPLVLASLVSALFFFLFTAFWLGNVARGDVWVWFAIWSRMAMPDSPPKSSIEA